MSRKGQAVTLDRPSPTVSEHGRRDTHSELTLPVTTTDPVSGGTDKPPYRVPSMAEIAVVPKNGLRVVSTFSGCGGSCLGFEMAGYEVLWANEFIPAAQDVYRRNHPGVYLSTENIRNVSTADVLAQAGVSVGEIDVLEGSPPCASFSTAGKREAHWGKKKAYSDTVEQVDDLFFEFVRLIQGIQPKVFVAENVSGLVKGTAKGYFKQILRAMKDCGYRVEARLLDAQWLGVPQARQRIIFVGVRSDLERAPAFPKPLRYRYSVRDALPWITAQGDNAGFGGGAMRPAAVPSPTIGASPQTGNGTYPPSLIESIVGIEHANGYNGHADMSPDAPMQTVQAQRPVTVAVRAVRDDRGAFGNGGDITDISRYAIGAEWDKLEPGEQSEKYRNLVKADPERPSPTILQRGGDGGDATVTHPVERRKFTIDELKRICAFPDDFILTGTYAQQWERLGRAVPPLMMRAVAETIRDEVLA